MAPEETMITLWPCLLRLTAVLTMRAMIGRSGSLLFSSRIELVPEYQFAVSSGRQNFGGTPPCECRCSHNCFGGATIKIGSLPSLMTIVRGFWGFMLPANSDRYDFALVNCSTVFRDEEDEVQELESPVPSC